MAVPPPRPRRFYLSRIEAPVPPSRSGAEGFYLAKQKEQATLLRLVLAGGETLEGKLAWVGPGMLSLRGGDGVERVVSRRAVVQVAKALRPAARASGRGRR